MRQSTYPIIKRIEFSTDFSKQIPLKNHFAGNSVPIGTPSILLFVPQNQDLNLTRILEAESSRSGSEAQFINDSFGNLKEVKSYSTVTTYGKMLPQPTKMTLSQLVESNERTRISYFQVYQMMPWNYTLVQNSNKIELFGQALPLDYMNGKFLINGKEIPVIDVSIEFTSDKKYKYPASITGVN